jgi:putative protein-disulfide isomerase
MVEYSMATALKKIIYIGDPMCSWCWGFAPVLHRLLERLDPDTAFEVRVGHLRSGQAWDDAFRSHLARHWETVHRRTGQPFDTALLERDTFNYDTEPACRAVCTARSLDPEKALDLFFRLQEAFYIRGETITDTEVIGAIAAAAGYEKGGFLAAFHSDAMRDAVAADRAVARTYGVSVFPSLVLIDREGHISILKGYREFDVLMLQLEL